ncbi:hypothetical protein J7E73_17140 [Paenibacillus albidus]|uniref:hypothetical protein n=1 Tax=Paenibacillus albidus TaxID=2041023 RepID=UPI001BE9192C|nr:hypothetical protein [Paenibacillus albidus]MBT2290827.1 hypothetical protein [Paenibacillus albidus]
MKKKKKAIILMAALLLPGLWSAGPTGMDKVSAAGSHARLIETAAPAAQGPTTDLKGAVNGNLPIHMTIKVEPGGKATGSYYYDKHKKTIRLTGNIYQNQVTLNEYDAKGTETGRFQGWWFPSTGFVGVWISPDGSRQLPVEALTAAAAANLKNPSAADWTGEWNMTAESPFRNARVQISGIQKDKLSFTIGAQDGGHSGIIDEGSAYLRNRIAIYKENDGSVVFFYLLNNQLYVVSPSPVYSAGANVTYTGAYYKGPAKDTTFTLKDLGVFKTNAEDKAFRKVVGDDYELFLSSMQLLTREKDQDGLKATVVKGGVRGLFTVMEAIVMYDAKGHYWAAVIGSQNTGSEEVELPQVQFYTNVPGTTKLPKTIDTWRQSFPEYKVIFMNK